MAVPIAPNAPMMIPAQPPLPSPRKAVFNRFTPVIMRALCAFRVAMAAVSPAILWAAICVAVLNVFFLTIATAVMAFEAIIMAL